MGATGADPAGGRRVQSLVRRLRAQASAAGHRLTLVLSGDPDWTAAAAGSAVTAAGASPVWLCDRPIHPLARPLNTATRLLGGECDLLIYDAWSGLDPDGFGAATGTLRGGGLLILTCPPLTDWPGLPDPQAGRIAPWPLGAAAVDGRFIARLVRVLRNRPGVTILEQGPAGAPPPPCPTRTRRRTSAPRATAGQTSRTPPNPPPPIRTAPSPPSSITPAAVPIGHWS